MVKQSVLSRAKINLMLRIIGQRKDGYHQLQTCFQILEWGDSIDFCCIREKGNNHIDIKGFTGLKKEDNLIYRAALSLVPYARVSSDWSILVEKNIPTGAGLGGGSSNAAETLKFLNTHWKCGLTQMELQKIGSKLGADIPVFISGHSALASGIGDELVQMEFNTPYILLIFAGTHISTQSIFQHPRLNRNQVELTAEELDNRDLWINDFFPLVLNNYADMNTLYQQLSKHIHVRLSGSGSTLFAVYNDESAAQTALKWADKYANCMLVRPKINTVV
ncbi:4-(cytidine 5'-diphospho)-2-C-methyl-D-erythritol kinase [Marinicella litoralis]|uniref:4-diphosphocytidyl-2-C-methyl-D-erythritol kinase n=1 Tax=Marinicella litoralis TaxID=644220 RepID=A0A4R6Y2J4_9GAMM|nr:4-(cytidine 5'-diphospho)-2-C-methyl-D-erythritol kinase [Marinicella litoralis]TDR23208.1 4-diphosphocytidyl-2-C-methyl-D-erythritol kinase [Marinicella litoralis]